jgi:hypothetical protein
MECEDDKFYDPKLFSYGAELEFSNVSRTTVIPPHLGRWDHSERDIVNTSGPARGRAADPLGLDPPFGGEINTVPCRGLIPTVERFNDIVSVFRGQELDCGPTAHTHIHVHVPGLCEDIEGIKRLFRYAKRNQEDLIVFGGKYEEHPDMNTEAKRYFKFDGGRRIPEYIFDNIESSAEDLSEVIDTFCLSKDRKSRGRPFRFGFNFYAMKHIGTIEFRMFRGTTFAREFMACLLMCEMFLDAALNEGPDLVDILQATPGIAGVAANIPKMQWNKELWDGLQNTKYAEDRGKKDRRFEDAV